MKNKLSKLKDMLTERVLKLEPDSKYSVSDYPEEILSTTKVSIGDVVVTPDGKSIPNVTCLNSKIVKYNKIKKEVEIITFNGDDFNGVVLSLEEVRVIADIFRKG